jgi:hypothetical protein
MRESRIQRLGLAAMLAAGFLGCFSATQRREEDLVRDARQWNDDFRWGRWSVLGQSMPADENALFQERLKLVDDDLVMADYEVLGIKFLQSSQAATVDVRLQWYGKAEPTVRQATLQQRWERRNARWMMVKQRRVRGDRFPLVPEPVAAPAAPPAAAPGTGSRPPSP